jgi:hypothetical protein
MRKKIEDEREKTLVIGEKEREYENLRQRSDR